MRPVFLVIVTLSLSSIFNPSFAQKAKLFPNITAANLNDETISLPADHEGKFAVIGVAFSEDAQDDLYTWGPHVYNMFIDKDGLNALVYDVEVNLLLLFTGVNKAAFNKAEKLIKEGTEETYRDNILLYRGEMGDYRDDLAMKDRKVPYVFVIDKKGSIIYSTSGRYTSTKMDEIAKLVEE
jgi:hypothetical protein